MFKESEEDPLYITMTEGDFGNVLPITVNIGEITSDDCFAIKIFKELNTKPILSKPYSNIQSNTIEFSLTQEETFLLPTGKYFYDLDWYQNGVFMCNLVKKKLYSVEDKAGVVNGS